MPTEKPNDPQFRQINLGAEVKKMWGAKWNEPEVEYEFSDGKKFYRRTGDAAIYEGSPDFG